VTAKKMLRRPLAASAMRQPIQEVAVEKRVHLEDGSEKAPAWNIISVTSIPPGWHAYYRPEGANGQPERRALIGWLVIEAAGRCSTVPGVFHHGEMVPATMMGELSYITDPQARQYY
jgi:hypothetical protein